MNIFIIGRFISFYRWGGGGGRWWWRWWWWRWWVTLFLI